MRKVYLVGIKGVAMTALALCLRDRGCQVLGSDVPEDFVTQEVLEKAGFEITSFDPVFITKDYDLVVYTGAHQGKNNPQVVQAGKLGIPTLSHAEALGVLTQDKKLISICGTGGKSTTSAMLAWVLDQANLSPSFAVGVGNIPDLGIPGRWVKNSEWFVAEADEYAVDPTSDFRPRFVFQKPEIIICTNLNYDHPDIYPNLSSMEETFLRFFNTLPTGGLLVINGDDPSLKSLVSRVRQDIRVKVVKRTDVDKLTSQVVLQVPGIHNAYNATFTLEVALTLGIKHEQVFGALGQFHGSRRRAEYKGELYNAVWYDDYAHTPKEIKVTLQALAQKYHEKRMVVIFQPHTYSRTKALFDEFALVFGQADLLILMDIFPSAREKLDETVSSLKLAKAIQKKLPQLEVILAKDVADATLKAEKSVKQDDLVVTMGAGDVYKVFKSEATYHGSK